MQDASMLSANFSTAQLQWGRGRAGTPRAVASEERVRRGCLARPSQRVGVCGGTKEAYLFWKGSIGEKSTEGILRILGILRV